MSLLGGVERRIGQIKDRLVTGTQLSITVGIARQIEAYKRLPQEKRKASLEAAIVEINVFLPKVPLFAHNLHGQLGVCYELLDQPQEAFVHFRQALDLHPSPTSESDFPVYVNNFLSVVNKIPEFPRDQVANSRREAVKVMTSLIPKVPDMEYTLRGRLGVIYEQLDKPIEALKAHEQAVLLHPTPTSKSDFPIYGQNYVNHVRRLTQRVIRNLQERRKEESIQHLATVVNSTASVLVRYPELEGLHHEHQAALGWFTKTVGPNKLRVTFKSGFSRN